jgi:catechol 2,3-dioxygenase-like lactoylglutathione lyase family enzyme
MQPTTHKGIHHIGIATHDMEATTAFYEDVLGFRAVVCEVIELERGGVIRHAFFDAGSGELFAFMECNDVNDVPTDFDAGINRGLGIRGGMYHFAFRVDDEVELEAKQADLTAKGVAVRGVVDHGWCKSIYFRDPNFLQLEYCCLTGELDESHAAGRFSKAWTRLARR